MPNVTLHDEGEALARLLMRSISHSLLSVKRAGRENLLDVEPPLV